MPHAAMHKLKEGKWRVTDAPDGWVDDGRLYPETKANDSYFDTEKEATEEYLNRVVPGRRERAKEE